MVLRLSDRGSHHAQRARRGPGRSLQRTEGRPATHAPVDPPGNAAGVPAGPFGPTANGVFATVLSLIPPFTPLVMIMRQAMPGGVPAWQPWLGLIGVTACALLVTWAGARVFRVGILLQGKPPRIGEILRWAVRG